MMMRIADTLAAGLRVRQPRRVNHTGVVNLRTRQPHTQSREAQRRVRQQERQAWRQHERTKC